MASAERFNVAFWTPLPPQSSGIADYSYDLINELARRLDLVAIVSDRVVDTVIAPTGVEVITATDYFSGRHSQFDLDVYQMGNELSFHGYMHAQILAKPGLLVLHDVSLVDFYRGLCGGMRRWIFIEEARYNDPEVYEVIPTIRVDGRDVPDHLRLLMSRRVVESSLMTLVHSRWARDELEKRHPVAVVWDVHSPAPIVDGVIASQNRKMNEIVFGVFGGLTRPKRVLAAMAAFARVYADFPQVRMVIVGRGDDRAVHRAAKRFVRDRDLGRVIRIQTDVQRASLEMGIRQCDVAVALRWPTAGETSAVVMRALGAGKPVIVSDLPQYQDLGSSFCWRVPTDPVGESEKLEQLMRNVAANPIMARVAGEAARAFAMMNAAIEIVADRYVAAIAESVHVRARVLPHV